MHDLISMGCDTVSAFAGRKKITAPDDLSSSRHPTKKCSSSWGWNGFYHICLFRASNRLHVSPTALNQELITLMSWGTGYSAPRRVTWTPLSNNLVWTTCSSIRLEQTSKQPFGSKVCKAAKGHRPPLIDSGWREDGESLSVAIDWMGSDPTLQAC